MSETFGINPYIRSQVQTILRLNYLPIFTIILTTGLLSCYNDYYYEETKEEETQPPTIDTIWIDVPMPQTNFEVLLASSQVYFLKHMTLDDDRDDDWESNDTLMNNEKVLKLNRKRFCGNVIDTSQPQPCIESQVHTINKMNGKVVKFSGLGSGYMAEVSFKYDAKGQLVEYNNMDVTFYQFEYVDADLFEITHFELRYGTTYPVEVIKFR